MLWYGWIWNTQRQRWERVCEVEGLSECSRRLGEIVRLRGSKEKYATMTGGAVPSFRPAGKRPNERSPASSPAAEPSSPENPGKLA